MGLVDTKQVTLHMMEFKPVVWDKDKIIPTVNRMIFAFIADETTTERNKKHIKFRVPSKRLRSKVSNCGIQ